MLAEPPPVAADRESVLEIRTAALSAAELCAQMLAYSGKGQLEKRDFCLGQVVGEMMHMLRTSISKKCSLHLDLGDQLPGLHGDPSQVRQVVLNLVINASEAIGDAVGSIAVTTGVMECAADELARGYVVPASGAGAYVFVEVTDTGCGMERETLQRMFEPFFTTKFTGRGLGLSAVLGIVQAHAGALRVRSEPGRGTTIRVLFPAASGRGEAGKGSGDKASWTGRGTVLVVDDEASVLTVTCKMLRRLGFEVLTANDGQEAVALYRERGAEIALVLMDLTMPRMGGEEAFYELRKLNPWVHVVLASGYDERDLAARFAGRGLAACIQKPYTLKKLAAVLGALLAGGP
jgi:CheY-like chemotaxis protein